MDTTFFQVHEPKSRQDRSKLLLVEGWDDAYFFDRLLQEAGADPTRVGIAVVEGKGKFERNLSQLLTTREFRTGITRSLALVRDSDENPAVALSEVHSTLRGVGLPEPDHGCFMTFDGDRKLGALLIPGKTEGGELEQLLLKLAVGDRRLKWTKDALDRSAEAYGPLPDYTKRHMQAYLACVTHEARGCGRAFQQGLLPGEAGQLEFVRTFVAGFLA